MVVNLSVDLKSLEKQGKDYSWKSPDLCPSCRGKRVWSHGFVKRYFDGFPKHLWFKRFRCADCRQILTPRPEGYLPRFQAPQHEISVSMSKKQTENTWIKSKSRQRQQYWFRSGLHLLFAATEAESPNKISLRICGGNHGQDHKCAERTC